ncbi:hypothetical protein [Mariprofundus ferrooxydans]|uniref:hypothetical protein n=1 Tax=Mariprofundus ferrooxydans TaxID=314344 RepID=UPI001430963C|nr:hypothetical protein [Mariprofundus ferrooxydans]
MDDFQSILTALLRGKLLKAPFIADKGESYREAVEKRLNDYVRRIEELKTEGPITNWLKSNVEEIKLTNQILIKALDEYLTGSAGKAYGQIEALMQKNFVRSHISKLREPLDGYTIDQHGGDALYRVRESTTPLECRSQIFHIPFDRRDLVGTQRFSIAGLPCLYLGTSLYVCWQEMGKPDLNKLYLSHYKVNRQEDVGKIYVLDFAYSLETLKHRNLEVFFSIDDHYKAEKSKAYLAIWPILMCCSFNKEVMNANFNVEYVIPNLILQWISKEKRPISGVRYFSTKTSQLRHSKVGINYVFPPSIHEPFSTGFCPELKKTFVFSKPVSWQLLRTVNNEDVQHIKNFQLTDDLEKELVENYKATQFYSMERKMNKLLEFKSLGD